jgi:SulP family sulfate permease
MAVLIAIESLMAAVDADRLTGDRHHENKELIAQGLANIASPLLGGLPVSGSSVRTIANIRSGARTRMAGVIHAIALLAIAWLFAPIAGAIPLPVLAAMLLGVAWTIGGWQELPAVLRMGLADALAWLVTFLLVLFADLTQAVPAAMAIAGLLFIRTVAAGTTGARVSEDEDEATIGGEGDGRAAADVPSYVAAFRITGPLLFAGTDTLKTILERLDSLPPIVILRLRDMTAADATSLRAVEALADRIRASGRMLLVSGAQAQPADVMRRMRFHDHLGPENVCETDDDARARARLLFQERFQPGFPFGAAGGPLTEASLASRHS